MPGHFAENDNGNFPKILLRKSKLVILSNLIGHDWLHTPKKIVLTWRNLWCLSAGKKSTLSFAFFFEILQRCCALVLWQLWACLATYTQVILSNCRKLLCLSAEKNQLRQLTTRKCVQKLYKVYTKIIQNTNFVHI